MKPLFFLLLLFLSILYANDLVALIAPGHGAHEDARVVDADSRSLVQALAETLGPPHRPVVQWIGSVCNWLTVPVATGPHVLSAVQRTYDDVLAHRGSHLVSQTTLNTVR